MILAAAAITAGAETNSVTNAVVKIRVTGDRVNMRAQPSTDAKSLEQALRGEELVFFEKTNGWVAAQAPASIDFWVAGEYVENGKVLPPKLNIRSGPSQNYSVVTVVEQGDQLETRGDFNGWVKVAPPEGSRIWISEDFVEIVEPEKIEKASEPEPEPEPELAPSPEEEELPPLMLVLDDSKPQGKYDEIPGILRRANPGLYKLVLIAGELEETICLVRGKESQLEKMLNRSLLIKGKVYWAKDVQWPVIQPEKIHLDPLISD